MKTLLESRRCTTDRRRREKRYLEELPPSHSPTLQVSLAISKDLSSLVPPTILLDLFSTFSDVLSIHSFISHRLLAFLNFNSSSLNSIVIHRNHMNDIPREILFLILSILSSDIEEETEVLGSSGLTNPAQKCHIS